jgi:diaminopimelate epimerase
VNTEFVQVVNDHEINMRVWERGSGETLACGTGACASVAATYLNRLTGSTVTVHLRGGDLLVELGDDGHVYMTGPATTVFEGELSV